MKHLASGGRTGLIATVALGGVLLAATAAGAQSMEEALAKAYANNPTLLGARARLRATDEGVSQALAGWRPTIELSYDAGRQTVDSNTSSRITRTPRTAQFSVSQNVYHGGRTVAGTREAEFNVQGDRARLYSVEEQVMRDAAAAYMDVVRDQAVLNLTISNEHVLQRQLEATRDRFNVGEVTRTDVAQAESRLASARSDRIGAAGNLEQSRASYRSVIGAIPGALKPAKPLGELPASERAAQDAARERNPDVMAAKFDERSASAAVDVAAADIWPTLDLDGALRRSDGTVTDSTRIETAEVFARLTVPLYQAGGVSSRIREAKEVVSQRRRQLEQAVRTSVQTATSAWQTLATARSQIRSFSAVVRAAEIALEGVKQEAQVGSRTVLDVLNAEQELLNARVNLVRAQRDEVVATFDLRRAVGTLTAQQLHLAVEPYDFDKHYKSVRGRWWGWDVE